MTEQRWSFDTETQRKFAYIIGLAYGYPSRCLGGYNKDNVSKDDIRYCASTLAQHRGFDLGECVRFAAQCSDNEFDPEELNELMDISYIWREWDDVHGLPKGTTACIGMSVGRDDTHQPDSKPED